MKSRKVPQQLLKRLNVYLSYLKSLPDSVVHISATSIAKALGLGDVQVRKDLARASDGGQKRVGHVRERLIRDIETFLDLSSITGAVIVCSGAPGHLFADYSGFEQYGLKVLSGFCLHSDQGGTENTNGLLPISRMEAFCREHNVRVGILAVSAEDAQEVCDRLIACGIQAVWNFSPRHLTVPQNVAILNENLAVSATALRIQLEERSLEQADNGS